MFSNKWLTVTIVFLLLPFPSFGFSEEEQRKELSHYRELQAYFNELGYTEEARRAGLRKIPRIYATDVPKRWRELSKEVTIHEKIALLPYDSAARAARQRAHFRGEDKGRSDRR